MASFRGGRAASIFLGSMLVVSCNSHSQEQARATPEPAPTPAVKPAPPTPLDVKKAELGGNTWDHAWDISIEKELPPEMLSREVPRDVRRFCPRFYQLSNVNKRAWWAYFFQAVAAAEAGLNPTTNVRHTEPQIRKIDSVTHELIHSEGLLQLTYEDATRYHCDFDWEADKRLPPHDPRRTILNPQRNLSCGLKILENQIFNLHEPLFARKSYWSTLQPGTESFRVFVKQMTDPPAACGLHTTAPVRERVATQTEQATR